METFADRLTKKMKELGYKQIDLIRLTGASRSAVSSWVNDFRIADGENLLRLASVLRVSPSWLLTGLEHTEHAELSSQSFFVLKYPILTYDQAAQWDSIKNNGSLLSSLKTKMAVSDVSKDSFWIEFQGDSMTSIQHKKCIPSGAMVLIDTDTSNLKLNDQFVVVRFDNGTDITVKQLIQDGPSRYLKPLNPNYSTTPFPESAFIVGVVKQVVIDF